MKRFERLRILIILKLRISFSLVKKDQKQQFISKVNGVKFFNVVQFVLRVLDVIVFNFFLVILNDFIIGFEFFEVYENVNFYYMDDVNEKLRNDEIFMDYNDELGIEINNDGFVFFF